MGNTQSTKPKRHFLTKTSKNVSGTQKVITTTLTKTPTGSTDISSLTTIPIKVTKSTNSAQTYDEIHYKNNNLGVRPNGVASLPPSPTQSDQTVLKETETLIIHGRKYQNHNKKYILPSDDEEQDRLVQVHFIYKHLFKGNFSAPVHDLLLGSSYYHDQNNSAMPPPRVLDVACGNGTWILEMATEYPESHFYGIDFDKNYPTTVKPSNTFFSQHDVLSPKGLPFPDNYFDYIHMRQVYSCFSESDWTTVIKEIKRVVKTGGYVEFRDIDPILKNMGPVTTKLFKTYPLMMKERQGVDVSWSRKMFDYLQNVGEMTDMHRQVQPLRFGVTAGPIGDLCRNSFRCALESHRLFFMNCSDPPVTDTEFNQIIDNVVDETLTRHSFHNYYTCWGRKPLFDYQESIPKGNSPVNNSSSRHKQRSASTDTRHTSYSSTSTIQFLYTYSDQEINMKSQFTPTLSTFAWNNSIEDDIESLGSDNVSDIDQFIEGYED